LSDEGEKKAPGQVNQQGSIGECASRADLNDALQSVAGQGADGSEQGNQHQSQEKSFPASRAAQNKKHLAPRGGQESSASTSSSAKIGAKMGIVAVMANSIAFPKMLQSNIFPTH
jgi:hypothetical protein